jgi:hypothetical protein
VRRREQEHDLGRALLLRELSQVHEGVLVEQRQGGLADPHVELALAQHAGELSNHLVAGEAGARVDVEGCGVGGQGQDGAQGRLAGGDGEELIFLGRGVALRFVVVEAEEACLSRRMRVLLALRGGV